MHTVISVDVLAPLTCSIVCCVCFHAKPVRIKNVFDRFERTEDEKAKKKKNGLHIGRSTNNNI